MRSLSTLLITGVALAAATPANAVAISGLWNTGVDATGMPHFFQNTPEIHYALTGGTAVTYKHPAWADVTGAYWITTDGNGGTGYTTSVYTLTFGLDGLDASTASLSGLFAADDEVTVTLNGNSAQSASGHSALVLFGFDAADFVTGTNVLTFTVQDVFGAPTGFVVTDLQGTADVAGTPAVPEPATWAMMMLGFGAVGFAARRRRAVAIAA